MFSLPRNTLLDFIGYFQFLELEDSNLRHQTFPCERVGSRFSPVSPNPFFKRGLNMGLHHQDSFSRERVESWFGKIQRESGLDLVRFRESQVLIWVCITKILFLISKRVLKQAYVTRPFSSREGGIWVHSCPTRPFSSWEGESWHKMTG